MNLSTEPVAVGNIVTILFAIAGTLFAKYGITEDDANEFVAAIGAIISAVITVISIIKQRQKVTPLVQPMNNEGENLVPAKAA